MDPETGKSGRVENSSYKEWYNIYVKDNPEAVFKEKTWKYRHGDKDRFYRYKEILGKKVPKSFKAFQELKYKDETAWKSLKLEYKDETLRIAIKTKYNLKIHEGRQGKHILGHNNYESGKSYLKEGIDPQELVYKYAGTGEIRRDTNGNWVNKEFITTGVPIGYWEDKKTGKKYLTNRFFISYSKTAGTHIVPAKPQE